MPLHWLFRSLMVAATGFALAVGGGGCDEPDTTGGADPSGAVHASAEASPANGFTGVFHRTADGKRSVLNLTERGGKLSGMLDAANISGEVSGERAHGDLRDAGTATRLGTVDLTLDGDSVVMTLKAIDPDGGEAMQLPPATYRRGAPPPIDVQLDAQLTGRWRHTWADSDASSSAVEPAPIAVSGTVPAGLWLILHPDGRIEHGRSSTTSDHASISVDSGGEEGFSGRWRTSERTLHVLPAGKSQWFPFARYQIEGEKLTLTYHDGNRQSYYRQ